ncbi:MAG: hypothetical protein GX887_06625 [Firmicutes bacterium]|nr:hypothetical protein [Bacillota bacterium]
MANDICYHTGQAGREINVSSGCQAEQIMINQTGHIYPSGPGQPESRTLPRDNHRLKSSFPDTNSNVPNRQ